MSTVAKLGLWLGVVCALVGLDMATRVWCFQQCVDGGGLVGFAPFANYHFAFSLRLPLPLMYVVYGVALSALTGLGWQKWREWNGLQRVAFLLILCGGWANVLERLWLGYVRDFIRVFHGYYNVADIYILVGIALLLFSARNAGMK